jgi:hypothetical protein
MQAARCIELSDFVQHLRTPQVALEMRLYELRGELVTGFSVVEELFPDGLIDTLVDDVVSRARALAAGTGWDDVPPPPAATGRSARLIIDHVLQVERSFLSDERRPRDSQSSWPSTHLQTVRRQRNTVSRTSKEVADQPD